MKAITLEELSRIWADYKIPRDVRAEKEIEDLAFDTMEWIGWHRPESLMPDTDRDNDYVLAIVSGVGKNMTYEHAIVRANWVQERGWYLLDDNLDTFTVERWAYCPDPPKEIQEDIDRMLKEENK